MPIRNSQKITKIGYPETPNSFSGDENENNEYYYIK